MVGWGAAAAVAGRVVGRAVRASGPVGRMATGLVQADLGVRRRACRPRQIRRRPLRRRPPRPRARSGTVESLEKRQSRVRLPGLGGQGSLHTILAFRLCDERLELGRGEGIDQSGLRDDQQQHLRARQDGQFVSLGRRVSHGYETSGRPGSRTRTTSLFVVRARNQACCWNLTFFMMPAFLLEKVMCRLPLSAMNLISIFLLSLLSSPSSP